MKRNSALIKLVCLLVAAPAAIYVLAVSGTVGLYSEYMDVKDLERSFSHASPADSQCYVFRDFGRPVVSCGEIVSIIGSWCALNGVTVGNYVPHEIGREGKMALYSADMQLYGGFVPLLKILSFIENSVPEVRMTSVKFILEKPSGKTPVLHLDVSIIQVEMS
ncbi:MAG: hypothetical protein NC115_01825 [Bacteroidales bacterium]|nr:hypothetical protein [Bacteroidales bacterium]